MRTIVFLFALLFAPMAAVADVVTERVEYSVGGVIMEGYIAYDGDRDAVRPGVLVAHAWMGQDDYARGQARQLAGLGYVAMALDMYGKGVRATSREQAAQLSGALKQDRALMRERALAALGVLRRHRLVDAERLGVIGYCFGGTVALELARSGAEVDATVSFHGGLTTPDSTDARNIVGSVLVLHGAADPYAPISEVAAISRELEAAGVDYQIVLYGGAVHAFTEPAAGDDPSTGAAYDPRADEGSWKAMKRFFKDHWGERTSEH